MIESPASRPPRIALAPPAPLTPRMAGVVERMARAGHQPFPALGAEAARLAYEKGAGVLEVPKPSLPRVEDLLIETRDGSTLPMRLYAPSRAVLPVLLFFHGGGFTVGSIATHDTLCRTLSLRSGCAVVSLDYRLAPAHRFPTAADDAWDALRQLAARASDWGLDGTRIAVGGDSAGGTLAAVCAIEARGAGLPLALQLLFYPGTSAHQDSGSHRRFAAGPVLDAALVQWFFDQYLRSPADREDWRFAPLQADDLEGVAPAWIGLAEVDPLVDEGIAYADRLRAAGVPVALEIYRGVTHEFIKMGRAVPEALVAHADAARALQDALKP